MHDINNVNKERMIINNENTIKRLFKELLNLEITDANFKAGYYDSSDSDLYYSCFGHSYCLQYDSLNDRYILLHRSTAGRDSIKHRMHFEWCESGNVGIERVIYKLSTRHNPRFTKDLITK